MWRRRQRQLKAAVSLLMRWPSAARCTQALTCPESPIEAFGSGHRQSAVQHHFATLSLERLPGGSAPTAVLMPRQSKKQRQAAAQAATAPAVPDAAALEEKNAPEEKQPVQKPRVSRRKKSTTADVAATIEAVLPAEVQHEVASGLAEENGASKKKKRSYANAYTRRYEGFSALVDSLAFEELPDKNKEPGQIVAKAVAIPDIPEAEAQPVEGRKKRAKRSKPAKEILDVLEAADAQKSAAEAIDPGHAEAAKPKRSRKKKVKVEVKAEPGEEAAVGPATEIKTTDGEGKPLDEAALVAAPKRQRKRRQADPNAPPPFEIPTDEVLEEVRKVVPGPRPVPNLGFACLNATLRSQKPPIFSNRDCIKRTFEQKGLDWISQLCVENTRALLALILWNHQNGIRFFRLSSKIFPWCTEWEVDQLPHKDQVKANLAAAGELARALDQRLTFHPSHFVKLGCEDGPLLDRSLKELEVHSQIMDLMGYAPSVYNKINIHIGGMYGDKEATMDRFAKNFRRLSPGCQTRLTVENDDWANSYSVADLLRLNNVTGIPIVFDFHHHRFCPGGLSEEEALRAALKTWPEGVRPVVHWSESQEGRRPSAHSDFVKGPLRLYGFDDKVDVMIEAKGKELALLRLRDPTFRPAAAALATISDDG